MILVNDRLNITNEWNNPENNNFKRYVAPRVMNLVCTAPLEAMAVAQNILVAPIQAAGVVLNGGAKFAFLISGSQAVKDFQESMPNLSDLIRTVARIVAYSIGTFLTATLGFISPEANFKAQCALGLAINRREESIKIQRMEAEVAKLAESAEKKEARERKARELEELNNMAKIYEIVNAAQKKAADDIAETASKMYDDVSVTVVQLGDEVRNAKDELGNLEDELVDALVAYEESAESAFRTFANDAMSTGSAIADIAFTGAGNLAGQALDLSKKVVNFVSMGYLFTTEKTA